MYNIPLPSYHGDYTNSGDCPAIRGLIQATLPHWQPVPPGHGEPGDVIILRIHGYPWHVGVMLSATEFLHADRKLGVVIERTTSPVWERRVMAVVRHPAMVPA